MLQRAAGFVGSLTCATLVGVLLTGCGGTAPPMNTLEEEIAQKNQEIESLRSEVQSEREAAADARAQAEKAASRAQDAEQQMRDSMSTDGGSTALLPTHAEPGECFARVLVPEQYENTTEQVLVREASARIDVTEPEYEFVEEKRLVREESERIEVVPATYEWVEERMEVKPASKRIVEVPAVYEDVTEQVLVSPERTYWKKGRGPVEKVDNTTGEIMCLITEPAVYKTVNKRVVKTPATTREIPVPAEFETVKRQVVKTPATSRTITIPAEYETVKVRRLAQPAGEKRVEIPAEYKTVNKRVMVEPSYLEWRPVVCETNLTSGGVRELQRALKKAGFDPGPIDGIYGKLTAAAVKSFQESKNLATGGLTFATVEALGVSFRGATES